MSSRILGIDPGLQITGYGVVETGGCHPIVCEAGIVRGADARLNMASRILSVYNGIVEVIEQFQPSVLAVEQLYAHYKHPRTAILMGHARGAVLLAAAQHGLDVVSYNAKRPSPATAEHRRIKCSGPSSGNLACRKHPNRPTLPTLWP
jgi:crossover junction endodeoxyribonuclease RuvC